MSRYPKKTQQDQETTPQRNPMLCAAYGCPLTGTGCNGLKGSSQWYCRFHNGQDVSQFDAISQRINRILPLIRHEHLIRTAGPVMWAARPEKYQTGNALIRHRPGESWLDYVKRLHGLILQGIYGGTVARVSYGDSDTQREDDGSGVKPSGERAGHQERPSPAAYRHVGDVCAQASWADQSGDQSGAEST